MHAVARAVHAVEWQRRPWGEPCMGPPFENFLYAVIQLLFPSIFHCIIIFKSGIYSCNCFSSNIFHPNVHLNFKCTLTIFLNLEKLPMFHCFITFNSRLLNQILIQV